jgi:adenylylsulfate kinase
MGCMVYRASRVREKQDIKDCLRNVDSKIVCEMLTENGITCERIEMDAIRKQYVRNPEYTDEERDFVYEKLVDFAEKGVKNNKNIIIDATAHKRLYREMARKKIKRFIEVMVRCPLLICIERESKREKGLVVAQMYRKALEDNSTGTAMDNARKVKEAIRRYISSFY